MHLLLKAFNSLENLSILSNLNFDMSSHTAANLCIVVKANPAIMNSQNV